MVYTRRTQAIILSLLLIPLATTLFYPEKTILGAALEADQLEISEEKTVARGNVRLTGSGWSLRSEHLVLKTGEEKTRITATRDVEIDSERFSAGGEGLDLIVSAQELKKAELSQGKGKSGPLNFRGEAISVVFDDNRVETLTIEGNARLRSEKNLYLAGDRIELEGRGSGWNLTSAGHVTYRKGETEFQVNEISGVIAIDQEDQSTSLRTLTAVSPKGKLPIEAGNGARRLLRIKGEKATLEFGPSGNPVRGNFHDSTFSTCECKGGFEGCAYSITAKKTSLIKGEIVLSRSAALKTFGFTAGASPLYFFPLKDVELPDRSYIPRVSFSLDRGISIGSAFPIYLNQNNFGNLLLDYYNRNRAIGLGLDFYSEGGNFSGKGELYGKYGFIGDDYFKVNATVDSNPTGWFELNANIDYRNGALAGKSFEENNWTLSLSSVKDNPSWQAKLNRVEEEETEDQNENSIEHVIERTPEFSFTWEDPIKSSPAEHEFYTSYGFYRENQSNWSNYRTGARGNLGGDFSLDRTLLEPLSLFLRGRAGVSQYFQPNSGNFTTRARMGLQPGIRLTGPGKLTAKFIHRGEIGSSPFRFDRVEALDRLSLGLSSSQKEIDQSLDFHYDFHPDPGFSDLTYELNYGGNNLGQTFRLKHDLTAWSPKSIETETSYTWDLFSAGFSTEYDFSSGSFSKTKLGLRYEEKTNEVGLELKGTPPRDWLEKISLETDLKILEDWSITFSGGYDVSTHSITDLSYSIRNNLQNCLEVGISGDLSGIRFGVGLAGF
ncbi:hypothetical protein K9M06_05080 [Candidatus Bipolaricaulota bacterium]|nr:hypothetical protein [Candidatus Bipolaricaulota bacterium]